MRTFIQLVFLSTLITLVMGQVVINEIHYNPSTAQGDDAVWEFLELYNTGSESVDLAGWLVGSDDANSPAALDAGGTVVDEFKNGGSIQTLPVEKWLGSWENYELIISDHRPVLMQLNMNP